MKSLDKYVRGILKSGRQVGREKIRREVTHSQAIPSSAERGERARSQLSLLTSGKRISAGQRMSHKHKGNPVRNIFR